MNCKPVSGKKHKTQVARKVDSVEELVLSQENAPDTHKTIRQIQKTGIPEASLHRIEAAVVSFMFSVMHFKY